MSRTELDTKDRLLAAAGEVFAEKGYRDATVAEICRHAEANIAAVNYYFGSKDHLYVEAWRTAFERGQRRYPPDGGLEDDAPPAERLRARITAMMRRILDPQTREFDIMRREMGDPTGLLDEAHHRTIDPLRKEMRRIVREILGPDATPGQVLMGVLTTISPAMHTVMRVRLSRSGGGLPTPGTNLLAIDDHEPLIEHVVRTVLAGLEAMRCGIAAGDWPDMELPDALREKDKDSQND